MRIRRMTATFGKLQGQSLELQPGLNILQAPNETGKSTWCAFLLSMLYGISSRERDRSGVQADKNRYAPWSGAAMTGRLDCVADGQNLSILRATRRPSAPFGEFQAFYTDTSEAVPGLTGANCGETLLGVSREVYARSAFIRQNGLAISQDAELERRIAALISSGEEDTSYSEAVDTLKKQLNVRKHNKTGRIPVLEVQLAGLQSQLNDAAALNGQISDLQRQEEALTQRESALLAELEAHKLWEKQQQIRDLAEAKATAQQKAQTAEALRRQLAEDCIPENETIARLRGAIVNLETTRRSVAKAREERDEAMKALLRAEAAVSKSPFAGQTPEQAKREVNEPPKVRASVLPAVLAGWAVLAAAAWILYALLRHPLVIAAACPLGVAVSVILSRQARKKARSSALIKRFGTADQAELNELVTSYTKLYEAHTAAQAACDAKSAAADTLYDSLSSNEQAILLEIRRFAPAAHDLSSADSLLRGCAIRRKELAEAEAAARDAQLRLDILAQQAPTAPTACAVQPPEREQAAVQTDLTQVSTQLQDCRAAIQRLTGQLSALGDIDQLQSDKQAAERQLNTLMEEYASITMALDALDHANAALQSRFAPMLGRRTAEIFSRMTDGRYSNVALDRSLHLSAEVAGDIPLRDIQSLSAGAADQLYLSARLAICQTVLPEESAAPIVLDDALGSFDDQRCAAALQYLKEEARNRQILLFTCHSREAAFFTGDSEVSIQQLTNQPNLV